MSEETPNEIQEIVEKIGELGIDSPDKLEGMAKASREAGQVANLLGEERKRSAELEAKIQELTQKQQPNDYEDGIDLGSTIRSEVNAALDARERKMAEAQQARIMEHQRIRGHKYYKLVGAEFEQFMNTPDAAMQMQSGKSPSDIFNEMALGKMQDFLVKMKDAVGGKSANPASVQVPHVEGAQTPSLTPEPDDEKKERVKKAQKSATGSDQDILNMLDALLPDNEMAGMI